VGRAPTLPYVPWHLPHNQEKSWKQPQSGYPKVARLIIAEPIRLVHFDIIWRWL
jgi:hypothetical protein